MGDFQQNRTDSFLSVSANFFSNLFIYKFIDPTIDTASHGQRSAHLRQACALPGPRGCSSPPQVALRRVSAYFRTHTRTCSSKHRSRAAHCRRTRVLAWRSLCACVHCMCVRRMRPTRHVQFRGALIWQHWRPCGRIHARVRAVHAKTKGPSAIHPSAAISDGLAEHP